MKKSNIIKNPIKNINELLDREDTATQIKNILGSFDASCKNVNFKKGIYIYGSPGCGKTQFAIDILTSLNYDIIKYDAGDVRNKSLIETITSNNVSSRNVLDMMTKTVKKIAIVMDEIDGMNNGDKGGITSLIKLIRQKKTKKQKLEHQTLNPIICIGNYYMDKKIRELMKVCYTFELSSPTTVQIGKILGTLVPTISQEHYDKITKYIQGDLRKMDFIQKIYTKNPRLIDDENLNSIFHMKSFSEDAKKITQSLIQRAIPIEEHNKFLSETDRTTVALLWHENIVDAITKSPNKKSFPFYQKILENICFADFIDRVTFQNQIWQFNEMSSLWKTFYNNKLYHDAFPEHNEYKIPEIRFTKVLTKYSTEYNNSQFIYELCQRLDMDKKDLIALFQELRLFYGDKFLNQTDKMNEIENLFENYDINKLDIRRIYRYLDKNVKKDTVLLEEDELSDIE